MKHLQFKSLTTRSDFGKAALIGLVVAGFGSQVNPPLFVQILLDIVGIAGIICAIKWLYLTIKSNK